MTFGFMLLRFGQGHCLFHRGSPQWHATHARTSAQWLVSPPPPFFFRSKPDVTPLAWVIVMYARDISYGSQGDRNDDISRGFAPTVTSTATCVLYMDRSLEELDTGSVPELEAKNMLAKRWYCNDGVRHVRSLGPKWLFSIGKHGERGIYNWINGL